MPNTVQAIVFKEANAVEVRSFPIPKCTSGTILCRTRYSVISPGTELRTLRGEQEGAVFPLVPGYAWVGQVEEAAEDVTGFSVGDWVCGRSSTPLEGVGSTWGGHASLHASPTTGYSAAVKLPPDVQPLDYVLTELGAISWRAMSMCVPAQNETAIVCGLGPIGALAVLWLLQAGVRVIAIDLDEGRLARARKFGALTVNGNASDAKDQVLSYAGGPVDIAVEASSSHAGARLVASLLRWPQAFNASVSYRPEEGPRLANYWPRLCFLASYTKTMELLPTGLAQVEGALVFYPRDRRVSDRQAVIDQIRKGVLKTEDFVGAPVPFSKAPEIYETLRQEPSKALTYVFSWE